MRYPNNFRYAKYLFQLYAFDIDRKIFDQKKKNLKEYMDSDLFLEFKLNKKRISSSPSDIINKIVHFDRFNCKNQTNQELKLLKQNWISELFKLQKNNILVDSKEWRNDLRSIKRVCVLGVTFDRHKNDNSTCCGTVLIFEMNHENKFLKLAYVNIIETKLNEHYIQGLEMFREDDKIEIYFKYKVIVYL